MPPPLSHARTREAHECMVEAGLVGKEIVASELIMLLARHYYLSASQVRDMMKTGMLHGYWSPLMESGRTPRRWRILPPGSKGVVVDDGNFPKSIDESASS